MSDEEYGPLGQDYASYMLRELMNATGPEQVIMGFYLTMVEDSMPPVNSEPLRLLAQLFNADESPEFIRGVLAAYASLHAIPEDVIYAVATNGMMATLKDLALTNIHPMTGRRFSEMEVDRGNDP